MEDLRLKDLERKRLRFEAEQKEAAEAAKSAKARPQKGQRAENPMLAMFESLNQSTREVEEARKREQGRLCFCTLATRVTETNFNHQIQLQWHQHLFAFCLTEEPNQ